MTDNLGALPPEIRKVLKRIDVTVEMFDTLVTLNRAEYDIIRAELLRLARIEARNADLHSENLAIRTSKLQMQAERNQQRERAEKAEAELAALKARMKPCARVRDGEVHVYMHTAHEGKKVAIVVVEE